MSFIHRWVEALKSGEYKQGTDYLRSIVDGEVRHCCLGVACDLKDNTKWIANHEIEDDTCELFHWKKYTSQEIPHAFITLAAGLFLAHLNDQQNYSFEDIAEVIESYMFLKGNKKIDINLKLLKEDSFLSEVYECMDV